MERRGKDARKDKAYEVARDVLTEGRVGISQATEE
jgi:hypothetical protein